MLYHFSKACGTGAEQCENASGIEGITMWKKCYMVEKTL